MKHFLSLERLDVGRTLALTVGSPSAHRRGTKLKPLFLAMLFLIAGVGNLWAVDPAVDDVIFKEEFGGNNIQASAYTFTGTTTWSGSTTGLAYASSSTSSLLSSATANPISSDNFFFVKTAASTLTMSGIAIPSNVTSATVSFQSNKTIVACTYSFTGGDDYATGATSISGVQSFDINCTNKSTLYLKFAKSGTSSNARIDNITVTVKTVSSGGSENPTLFMDHRERLSNFLIYNSAQELR